MVVRKFWVPAADSRESAQAPLDTSNGQAYSFETGSDPFYPRGEVRADPSPLKRTDILDLKDRPARQASQDSIEDIDNVISHDRLEHSLQELAFCAGLCNQASLHRAKEDGQWEANGDPTEIALQVAAHKLGYGKPFLTHHKSPLQRSQSNGSGHSHHPPIAGVAGHYEQLIEHPFDSTVKRMSIAYIYRSDDGSQGHILCLLKGAVERVFEKCTKVKNEELTEKRKEEIIAKMDALAAQGLRVLALCGKRLAIKQADRVKTMTRDEFENDFAFLGLAGIFDPPRKESAGAVADCLRAGILPRMLTGDHPATATAIALSIGILEKTYAKGT